MKRTTYTIVYDDVYSSTNLDFGEKIVLGKILHLLKSRPDKPISNEYLMKCCGIESTAVNTFKRIKKRLVEKGYINYNIRYSKELNCNATYYSIPIKNKEPTETKKEERIKITYEIDNLSKEDKGHYLSRFREINGQNPTTYEELNNFYINNKHKYNEAG